MFKYLIFLCLSPSLYALTTENNLGGIGEMGVLAEQFKRVGYVEICDTKHGATTFDSLCC